MSTVEEAREKALELMAESLLRELSNSEETLLIDLLKEHAELQTTFAAFQAMASSKTLLRHDQSATQARARFLAKAQSLGSNNTQKASFFSQLVQSHKLLGGAFLLAQAALVIVFVQVLNPSNEFEQQIDEPIYRSGSQVACGDYEATFKADANFPELFLLMAQSGISIAKGPDLLGRFELFAPGTPETELRELLSIYTTSLKKTECSEKIQ